MNIIFFYPWWWSFFLLTLQFSVGVCDLASVLPASLSGLHSTTVVCLSAFNPSLPPDTNAPISPQLTRRWSIPPFPSNLRRLSLSHFMPLGVLSIPHASCSVLVGGIEESILFLSMPCMLLLARWFSHPAATPPPPTHSPGTPSVCSVEFEDSPMSTRIARFTLLTLCSASDDPRPFS
jgi:hypothetical protein